MIFLFHEIIVLECAGVMMFKMYKQYMTLLLYIASATDNVIDYYHFLYIGYCQIHKNGRQLQILHFKLQKCIGDNNLIKHNIIYWTDNPFQFEEIVVQPNLLVKRKLYYLSHFFQAIKSCNKNEYNFYIKIFTRIKSIKQIGTELCHKIEEIQVSFREHFPLLNESDIQQFVKSSFLSQNQFARTFLDTHSYQNIQNRPYYLYIIMNLYRNNKNFSSERFISSFNQVLVQHNKNESEYFKKKIVCAQTLYNDIFMHKKQQLNQSLLIKLTQYLQLSPSTLITIYRKKKLINFGIDKIYRYKNIQSSSPLMLAVNRLVLTICEIYRTQNCLDVQNLKEFQVVTYAYLFCQLLKIGQIEQYQNLVFLILRIVQNNPSRDNIKSLIQIMIMLFGYPSTGQKLRFTVIIEPCINNSTLFEDVPHTLFLYIFVIFKRTKQSPQQISFLFRMLNKHVSKLHKMEQQTILQLILYKIVDKKSQYLTSLNRNKSQRQLQRIKAWAIKRYLKKSLHKVKTKDLIILLIKRNRYDQLYPINHYNQYFLKYLAQYSNLLLNKVDFRYSFQFPNPF